MKNRQDLYEILIQTPIMKVKHCVKANGEYEAVERVKRAHPDMVAFLGSRVNKRFVEPGE